MYSHIIFDLDGTLVDSLTGIAAALNAALAEHGLPTHQESVVRTFIGDGAHTLCQRAAKGQDKAVIDALHQSFMREYAKTWKSGTLAFAGIHELLTQLKQLDYKLSILSNKPHAFTTEIVNHFFPEKPFDLVLGQREGISKKPDPSGVHEMLCQLVESSANSILVGDSTVDVITARNAGIRSVAVTWGYHTDAQLTASAPNYTAKSMEQLYDILKPKNVPAFRESH